MFNDVIECFSNEDSSSYQTELDAITQSMITTLSEYSDRFETRYRRDPSAIATFVTSVRKIISALDPSDEKDYLIEVFGSNDTEINEETGFRFLLFLLHCRQISVNPFPVFFTVRDIIHKINLITTQDFIYKHSIVFVMEITQSKLLSDVCNKLGIVHFKHRVHVSTCITKKEIAIPPKFRYNMIAIEFKDDKARETFYSIVRSGGSFRLPAGEYFFKES